MSPERVRVIGPYLGGGYGNKDESRLAAIAAVLASRAGRPVRIEYSREDEFVAGRVRHAARIRLKAGLTSDGSITALHASALLDTGAYLASGPGVARRTGQGVLYLYHCPNVKYEARLAYTNRPVAGSYRALGAPQGHFALESLMDRAAERLGLDPLDFRLKNRVRPEGQPGRRTSPPGQVIDSQPVEGGIPFSSNGLEQCLELGCRSVRLARTFARLAGGRPGVETRQGDGDDGLPGRAGVALGGRGAAGKVGGHQARHRAHGRGRRRDHCAPADSRRGAGSRFRTGGGGVRRHLRHSRRADHRRVHGHVLHRHRSGAGGGRGTPGADGTGLHRTRSAG